MCCSTLRANTRGKKRRSSVSRKKKERYREKSERRKRNEQTRKCSQNFAQPLLFVGYIHTHMHKHMRAHTPLYCVTWKSRPSAASWAMLGVLTCNACAFGLGLGVHKVVGAGLDRLRCKG